MQSTFSKPHLYSSNRNLQSKEKKDDKFCKLETKKKRREKGENVTWLKRQSQRESITLSSLWASTPEVPSSPILNIVSQRQAQYDPVNDTQSSVDGEHSSRPSHTNNGMVQFENIAASEFEEERVGGDCSTLSESGFQNDEDTDEFGPPLPSKQERITAANYGHNLLPGEGSAMAAYVQEGRRIPRRVVTAEWKQYEYVKRIKFIVLSKKQQQQR
ncbi:uncharacterized protein Gasu_11360 [Galdieria sulphuraria]|uniref:NF-kappa-B-activating protein C-terminal domain-containing protein n=1 Tax=Galdieria sulphuraria TaxID=130081 RepID=M2W7G6_GALSU|nr:uncharacterized protein Gasu_11360 [Galdieria sulphuraria]EME31761.1 hypothetical protein Gasu_11360 [Galdieria sulphuraria]|eukprot:XP_005708281.1 hypothetical protein Gasu_11360 [Galdieria sulphuraria]